jgi:hypothetical protein
VTRLVSAGVLVVPLVLHTRPRRTRRCHPQMLEGPDQAALLPAPGDPILAAITVLQYVEKDRRLSR